MGKKTLTRFAWLSVGAAVVTIALKALAYLVTGSVGLLSDALESCVNLAAALMALAMLGVAARDPDETHPFGYSKAEYFSSGLEGALIVLAAAGIVWSALPRLISPQPLEQIGIGLGASVIASAVNFAVGRRLLKAGREHRSMTLEADAHHLLTDVWTSAGIIAGIAAVYFTGWNRLDPLIALIVAANIVRIGAQLLRRSVLGLMDSALPATELAAVGEVLAGYERQGVRYHALRTRRAGARAFVSLHVLVPGGWSVRRGHDLLENIERDIRAAVPNSTVFTHLEALEDPAAWEDLGLDRAERAIGAKSD
ncbi:MAG TPA: cation diffusion facilitator family transporter [Candidatus Binatia bacterium]|jgi:cation diffusion facilitator family transporter